MRIIVDAHSGVPVYRQILDQIKFEVESGLLRPGDEIPSTRSLSAELGINPMTVSKAFGLLEEEGVIERRPGLPSVVRARSARVRDASKMARLRAELEPVALRVHRLGIDPGRAAGLFRELLDEHAERGTSVGVRGTGTGNQREEEDAT